MGEAFKIEMVFREKLVITGLNVFLGSSSHLVLVLVGTHSLVLDYWYFQVGVCGCQ